MQEATCSECRSPDFARSIRSLPAALLLPDEKSKRRCDGRNLLSSGERLSTRHLARSARPQKVSKAIDNPGLFPRLLEEYPYSSKYIMFPGKANNANNWHLL
jgi:hypothetical protein